MDFVIWVIQIAMVKQMYVIIVLSYTVWKCIDIIQGLDILIISKWSAYITNILVAGLRDHVYFKTKISCHKIKNLNLWFNVCQKFLRLKP